MESQINEWVRNHDLTLWASDRVEKMKLLKKNIDKKLNMTKKVLKQSAVYMRKAYDSLKNVSDINTKVFKNFKPVCKKRVRDQFFRFSIIVASLLCNYDMKFSGSFLGKKKTKQCFAIFFTLSKLYRKLNNLDAGIFFRSIMYDLKNVTLDKIDAVIDRTVNPLLKQFEFEAQLDLNTSTHVSNSSSYRDLLFNIASVYQERLEFLNANILPQLNLVLPISLLFVIYSSLRYHNKYMRRDYYENNVMGVKFLELEEKRRLNGKPTVLPLNSLLKNKFVGLFDLRLTKREQAYTWKSLSRLMIIFVPILLTLWLDDILVSVNEYVASNTLIEMQWEPNELMKIHVVQGGKSFLGQTYKQLFESFKNKETSGSKMLNNLKCLPKLSRVNGDVHYTISFCLVLLLVLTSFQAYIKRSRALLAGCVYPDRDQERAVWLYNHILALYTRFVLF